MNREAKLGMLVGLIFVIAVGILLADYGDRSLRPAKPLLLSNENMLDSGGAPGSRSHPAPLIVPSPGEFSQPMVMPLALGTAAGKAQAAVSSSSQDAVAQTKEYKAKAGDTVWKIARSLGGDTKANCQAIIKLNNVLRDNPDKVVPVAIYIIPILGSQH